MTDDLTQDIRIVRWGNSRRLAITGMAPMYTQDTIKARCGRGSRWEYRVGDSFTITFLESRKPEVVHYTLADDLTAN